MHSGDTQASMAGTGLPERSVVADLDTERRVFFVAQPYLNAVGSRVTDGVVHRLLNQTEDLEGMA